jgi:microcystin-dependent protein
MSNYTKIQNWASLTDTTITGTPFDTEFAAVAEASATKSNKKIPATTNNLASLSSSGDLQDSGVLASNVADAVSFHYATGDVKMTAADSEPTGWLYCDGASLSTSTYSDLFSVIGYEFGGSGASFDLPDLRGRTAVGMDNLGGTSANVITDAAADGIGGTYGTETVTLAESEMPAHTHTLDIDTYAGHDQVAEDFVAGVGVEVAVGIDHDVESGAGAHTHTGTAETTGGDGAHLNVQPSLFMNYLIKT